MQSSLGSRMSVKGMDCSSSRCCRSPLAVSLGSSSGRGGSPSRYVWHRRVHHCGENTYITEGTATCGTTGWIFQDKKHVCVLVQFM
ncbi:hypothetical protein CIB84_009002 [Bambusicola thoracicus]|uniref:Uncharacterized protein n=1 Tax=Bambusicola thoracicus TaxID=9083 RepID=A0A2P4SSZ7_BAMTH|nr:hypothetical protein CIB84_009002 [Bambusicola thoracicus]